MGQVLHPRARTTQEVRREIQLSKESIAVLAERFGVNPKTVAKWKGRDFVEDAPMGYKTRRTTITEAEEKAVLAFHELTRLPLDDTLYVLQETIPLLSRSALYRCLRRNGCPMRSAEKGPRHKAFKSYPIGFFHIDIAQVQTAEGKLYLFVAIDRTSKFTVAKLYPQMTQATAGGFLQRVIDTVPYPINKILTDNGSQFVRRASKEFSFKTVFERICHDHNIEHRKTQVCHPWTNGQVERMNRTLKEATVKTYYYATHEQLCRHLEDFLNAYNFGKRLKTLQGLTPWQFILEQQKINFQLFRVC